MGLVQLTERTIVIRDGDRTSLFSRQGKRPRQIPPGPGTRGWGDDPPGCIVDGEAAVWSGDRLDFDALQRRLSAGKDSLRELPASFVGFDVLCVAGQDTRHLPLRDRRALLEELATEWSAPLSLSPTTTDPEIIAGLPVAGRLRIVGRSAPLTAAASRALAKWLRPATPGHPWPVTVKGTTLDRFNRDATPVTLTLVEPIVVEVAADTAWSGRSFRHALRFERARPELDPTQVTAPAR
ncbi:ATP-dependent DNA ligase [Arthrobacter sp. M4]|uniref:ATP-dependent DNA ligase n=1 Tax=Arthrobacter sp. M4 TaxID=218160 RepID=UPI001CDD3955|nr:ATP-dependent DNA ligase [Arthrobacter sp. M4]MCA4135652.1 ATP-dependent DNA ligase [Arthrobacter sp. M4]